MSRQASSSAPKPTPRDEAGVRDEVEALRRWLDSLAAAPDDALIERYELKRPPMPPGLYWKARWLAGRILRTLRSIGFWRPEPWPVALKEAGFRAGAKPLVIWAVGAEREDVRAACRRFAEARSGGKLAPVLVTDIADFAFFSRLGWLVEYVPQVAGEGPAYDERKLKFLARLYRAAPALPVSALLQGEADFGRWIDGKG